MLRAFDAASGNLLWNVRCPPYRQLIVSADDQFIVGCTPDAAEVRERLTGALLLSVTGHTQQLQTIAMSSDARRLVTAGADCTALVWDLVSILAPSADQRSRSIDELSRDLSSLDPHAAYTSGLEMLRRDPAAFKKLAGTPPKTETMVALIQQLSDPDLATRERAHRELERAGQAAAPAIVQALRDPPPGEAGERLRSLARLIQVAPATAEPATGVSDAIRAARILGILRLGTAPPPTTQPR
jgi:hypothetical protein